MATAQQQQVFQQWFVLADEDRDGAIAGAEAVKFFQRSGLDQGTLGQIWDMVSAGGAKLNQAQFSIAMRLVALAQTQGGRLAVEQARVVAAGLGPALPTPRMAGLEQQQAPTYSPQPTGPLPGAAPGTYPAPGMNYAAQYTGASAGPAAAGYTGASAYQPQPTGAAAGATGAGGLAPCTPADLQRYQTAFLQLDGDRDGLVKGAECFGYFMQWGLDKAVLRHIWEVVAGNSSSLNQQQFTSCLYLMDAAKRGIRPPAVLPPGPFPPVAQQWSLASQFGGASVSAAAPAVSQQAMVLPSMPGLPVKFTDDQSESAVAPVTRPSQVPNLGSAMPGLAPDQRDKLGLELKDASDREAKLFTVEDRAAAAKARSAALNAAMQEITVFKSRTEVAMLQAQEQVSRLEEELVVTRAKYDKAYATAQTQGEAGRKLREYLGKLMADKTDAEGKLLQLEAEIAAATAVTPQDVARMEAEVKALHDRVLAQEQVLSSKSTQLAEIRRQRTALNDKLAEADAARASADKDIRDAQKQVTDLQAAITAARAQGGVAAVAPLLSKAAELYRNLYTSITKTGAAVPFDCLPANLTLMSWMDDAMAGVVDWNNLDDESRGYILVNAMPGQRIDVARFKSMAPAASQAAPAAPAAAANGDAPVATAAGGAIDAFGEAPAFGAAPASGAPGATPAQPHAGAAPGQAEAPAAAAAAAAAPPVGAAAPPTGSGPVPMDMDANPQGSAFGPAPGGPAATPAPGPEGAQKAPSPAPVAGAPAPTPLAPAAAPAAATAGPTPAGPSQPTVLQAAPVPAAVAQPPAPAPAAGGFGFDDNAFA